MSQTTENAYKLKRTISLDEFPFTSTDENVMKVNEILPSKYEYRFGFYEGEKKLELWEYLDQVSIEDDN